MKGVLGDQGAPVSIIIILMVRVIKVTVLSLFYIVLILNLCCGYFITCKHLLHFLVKIKGHIALLGIMVCFCLESIHEVNNIKKLILILIFQCALNVTKNNCVSVEHLRSYHVW